MKYSLLLIIFLSFFVGTIALLAWLIHIAPTVDDESELCAKPKRSPIQHDYKHLAAIKKPSNEFDAGALTGAAVTLVIFALLLAFTAPANAEPFVDVGISVHRALSAPKYNAFWNYDINVTRNPYGVVAIGYREPLNKHFSLSIEARHESSLVATDHGTNSLQLMLRWMPTAKL